MPQFRIPDRPSPSRIQQQRIATARVQTASAQKKAAELADGANAAELQTINERLDALENPP